MENKLYCACAELTKLYNRVKDLEYVINQSPLPQMYRIKMNDYKVSIVCDHCYSNGEVDIHCKQCGGKGVHNKTKQRWEVHHRLEDINKINRDENGEIRYWTDMSCFFSESDNFLHFTKEDAMIECNKRNKHL